MATLSFTEGIHNAEMLISEANGARSREQVTLITGQAAVLAPGTVLGIITASGKYTEMLPAGTDGSEVSAAILLYECDAVSADNDKCVVLRRDCEVNKSELAYEPSGTILAGEIVTADAELATQGIVVRPAI